MVHAINSQSMVIKGERDTLLLNTLVNKNIEISATLIRADTPNKLFGDQGLIIADGDITFASDRDVVSIVDSNGKRVPQESHQQTASVQEIVDKTITDLKINSKSYHNEMFLKNMNFSAYQLMKRRWKLLQNLEYLWCALAIKAYTELFTMRKIKVLRYLQKVLIPKS
jgi:hypothetical protein